MDPVLAGGHGPEQPETGGLVERLPPGFGVVPREPVRDAFGRGEGGEYVDVGDAVQEGDHDQ